MANLKPVYDAVKAAEEKVNGILAEMSGAFEEGTPEGVQRALALRPQLDEAKAEADRANELYVSMRDASQVEDSPARKFVPVGSAQGESSKKVITRAEWEEMDPQARHNHLKQGGSIVDSLEDAQ